MSKLRVAVLMGGSSAERAVSLSTGRQILSALDSSRYCVAALDTATGRPFLAHHEMQGKVTPLIADDGFTAVTALTQLGQTRAHDRPDVVIIALHGPGGEDGAVQGMLDVLGIPYTGSGVLASALAMDKAMCKRVLGTVNVRMPRDVVLTRDDDRPLDRLAGFPLPAIVKPNTQGSTIGITRVDAFAEFRPALDAAFAYDHTVIVEQFIHGTEITAPIIGNSELTVLPLVEIVPAKGFYDYEAKYTPGATDEIVPARIPDAVANEAREIAVRCHRTLGCRGMSRTDMIVDAGGLIFTLETNTIPGMTPTSLLPRAAEAAGIPFPELLDRLIALALEGR